MAWIHGSTGLMRDFDADGSVTQIIGYGRTGGYSMYSTYVDGAQNSIRKTLPSPTLRVNCAMAIYWSGSSQYNTNLFGFHKAGTSTLLAWLAYANSTKLLEFYRDSSVLLGRTTTQLLTGKYYHIEVDYFRDPVVGFLKVWVNGILEIDFTGNTGATDTFTQWLARCYYLNVSDLYVQTDYTERLGDVRIAFIELNAPGDGNDWEGNFQLGSAATTTNATTLASNSYIVMDRAKANGFIDLIQVYGKVGGNIKLLVAAANGAGFVTKQCTDWIALTAVNAVQSFVEGTDFPMGTLKVDAGDYIGIVFDSTAKIGYNTVQGVYRPFVYASGSMGAVGGTMTVPASTDGFIAYCARVRANPGSSWAGQADNPTYSLGIVDSAWTNTPDAKLLANTALPAGVDIGPVIGVQVSSLLNIEGVPAVTKANAVIKTGIAEAEASLGTLTTTMTVKHAFFSTSPDTGTAITPAELANLQIGLKAKA